METEEGGRQRRKVEESDGKEAEENREIARIKEREGSRNNHRRERKGKKKK